MSASMASIVSADEGFQFASARHTLRTKFCRIRWPYSLCVTSGWNCTPNIPSAGFPIAATAQSSVEPSTWKPLGSSSTESPWLTHTELDVGMPSKSPSRVEAGVSPASESVSFANPYSRE
jgi:hypothetical protein